MAEVLEAAQAHAPRDLLFDGGVDQAQKPRFEPDHLESVHLEQHDEQAEGHDIVNASVINICHAIIDVCTSAMQCRLVCVCEPQTANIGRFCCTSYRECEG